MGSSTEDFERWMKGALEMGRLSLKRLTGEGSFTGDPGLQKEGSGNGHLSSWGLSWATWNGLIYQRL